MDDKLPQWARVLDMLKRGTVTTAEFCSTPGLAAEYRRAISDLRRKGYVVSARKLTQGRWEYSLEAAP